MDDIIVEAESPTGEPAKLSLQVKRALRISGAESNTDFRKIILAAYSTVTNPEFRTDLDQVGLITGSITDASKRAVESVCSWAKSQDTPETFLAKISPGVSNDEHRKFHEAVRKVLKDSIPATQQLDAEVHRLLRHFVLMEFDLLHDGAKDESDAVSFLRYCLHPSDAARSGDLWSRLRVIAREAAGQGAVYSRTNLIPRLHGSFRLAGALSLRKSLDLLSQEAQLSLRDIAIDVMGSVIPRTKVIAETKDKLKLHSFVQIIGLPGTGKSAVLRLLCDELFKAGSGLFLKTDKLSHSSWSAYATSIGLDVVSLELLLLEITLCGTPILAIDGLDRMSPESRGIVRDILNTILGNPVLKSAWSIAATVRDGGIEDIRTWLPSNLFDVSQPAMVEVKAFDDDESKDLADALPTLRTLLFSENDQVREIARRPFFAAVIGKSFGATQGSPVETNSEIQLIEAWWARGGYNAEPNRILYRTETLRHLAANGAATLGRGISLSGIDLGAVTELKNDGILKDGAPGSIRFSHDIFFEWSYFHVLLGHETEWPKEIRRVGEPPVLGRVVELLSQKVFVSAPANWGTSLASLETSDLRPQWARAWLLGPISYPEFLDKATPFTNALFHAGANRVHRLAVWFQAEKTRPNPGILGGSIGKGLSLSEAVRLADLYAWPSDIPSWQRGCKWFIDNISKCPVAVIPDIVSVFEVWQNAWADHPNSISRQIMVLVHSWLIDIEDLTHAEDYRRSGEGQWNTLPEGGMKELEQRLRHLFVRSARTLPNEVKGYLARIVTRPRLREKSFKDILTFSPILAQKIGPVLVDLLLAELKEELPNDVANRPTPRGVFHQGPTIHDRLELALNSNTHAFYPASPLWEPFPSLFKFSAEDGLRAVRELSNHAITAWRQFCALYWEDPSTPIPLVMDLPWGRQTFWGGHQTYTWFRGNGGSDVLSSALMALEKWALSELEKGRDADDLIRQILAGHESCAILGIAVVIALQANKVSATTLPLISCQALWWWDIARLGYDRTSSGMLLSFHKTQDHVAALREQNSLNVRKLEIRNLAMCFVLCRDETLSRAAQSAIQAFPENIHYETEEEKRKRAGNESDRRQALIWAEWGKPENYTATHLEKEGKVLIELDNPTANDPDVAATRERAQTLNQHLGLLNWADESYPGSQISARMSLSEALDTARALEGPDLFTLPPDILNFTDQAVAAVAAVTMKFASSVPEADQQWAADIIFRATKIPEPIGDEFHSFSDNPHQVGLHALRGLAFMVRGKIKVLEAQQAMIWLAAHPRRSLSKAALSTILGLWDNDKRFSWLGLNLVISRSIGYWNGRPEESRYHEAEHIAKVVDAAIAKLASGGSLDSKLPQLPPAWEFAPARPIRGPFDDEELPAGAPLWRSPDTHFNHRYLSSLLRSIPFREILKEQSMSSQFLTFCKAMTEWTVERISPTWDTQGQGRSDRDTNIFEWKVDLSRFLGQVATHLEPEQVKNVFLDVVAPLDDDEFISLLMPFLDMLSCGIMDEAILPENGIRLMQECLPRILSNDDWAMLRRRSSRHLDGDLSRIVSALFFVQVNEGKAPNSARFANGNWSDVGKILPIVDSIVMAVGDNPRVASLFLTLCERAGAQYPMEKFLNHMHGLFKLQPGTPVGWRETYLPNRIASLIQSFATRAQPLPLDKAQSMLRLLDRLVDMGDRRATALQTSELFKNIRANST